MIVVSTENYTVLKARDLLITELQNELIETLKIRKDLPNFLINENYVGLLFIDFNKPQRFYSNVPLFAKAFKAVINNPDEDSEYNAIVYQNIIFQANISYDNGDRFFSMSFGVQNKKDINKQFTCECELLVDKANKPWRILCKIRHPNDFDLKSTNEALPEVPFKMTFNSAGDLFFQEFGSMFDKHLITGVKASDILSNSSYFFHYYIRPENLSKVQAAILSAFENKQILDIEFRVLNMSGNIRYHRMTAYPVKDNKSIVWHGRLEDVTASKFKYNEIERLALVAKNTSDIILLCDFAGDVIWTNDSEYDILGYTREEVIGYPPAHNRTGADTDKKELENLLKALSEHINYQGRIKLYKKSGEACWMDYQVTPVWNEKKEFMYCIVAKRDVTLLMKHQDELKDILDLTNDQNSRLKNYAHVLSHNIRSHVANLAGLMQLINISETLNEKGIYLGEFDNILRDLENTIARLNELLSIESQHKASERIDISNLISNEIETVFSNLSKYDIELSFEKPDSEIHIEGIEVYLREVFHEIFKNCLQFRKKRDSLKVLTTVSIKANHALIKIEDNGLGMSPEFYEGKIFSMFRVFHPSLSGKGLSLYLVKRLIEKMKGQIEIKSEYEKGTTVSIWLPLAAN